jgi:hypothetical protein
MKQLRLTKPLGLLTLHAKYERATVMTPLSASINKRKAYVIAILMIVGFVFTADILDLREELRILSCPYSCLDNNVTTGITTSVAFEMEPVQVLRSVDQMSSVTISFLHLLPYGFRAPPAWS